MARCRHRVCGEDFSGLTAFDRHLRWHKGPPWVSCREPLEAGLVWSDAREAWATHIGPLSGARSGGIPAHRTDGKSAGRPERKRPVAS